MRFIAGVSQIPSLRQENLQNRKGETKPRLERRTGNIRVSMTVATKEKVKRNSPLPDPKVILRLQLCDCEPRLKHNVETGVKGEGLASTTQQATLITSRTLSKP